MSTLIQRSFSSGEIAPALYSRVDFYKYQTGLRTCRNFFIMRHGGATNRPGTEYVTFAGEEHAEIRLIPFQINASSSCVLEFGGGPAIAGRAGYMRVHKNGAPVTEAAKNITGWNYGVTFVRITVTSHGWSTGDQVYITGVTGSDAKRINDSYYIVKSIDANTLELYEAYVAASVSGLVLTGTWDGSALSGGTVARIYSLATGIVNAALPDMQFAQKDNVLTLVHPDNDPIEITRTSDTSWAKATISFGPATSPPTALQFSVSAGGGGSVTHGYKVTIVNVPEFEESLPTAAETDTGDAPSASNGWLIGVVAGTLSEYTELNVYKETNGIYGLIGVMAGTNSANFEDVGIDPDTSKTPPYNPGYFVGTNQVPGVVSYFQQRLILAGTNANPGKVWMSKTGFFKNFTIRSPIQDDDSIVFEIAGKQVQDIKHIVDVGRLVIFTSGGEWTLEGSDLGVLTPTTLNLKQQSYNGASKLPPLVITNSCLYVQARGSIVRDFGYDFQSDGYKGNDLTIFNAHLFDGYNIDRWTYQQVPHSNIWAARDDGKFLCLTYIREQSLVAWSRHDMQDATVSDVCSISEDGEDYVYFLVTRTIGGQTGNFERTTIERMSSRQWSSVKDAKFLDSSVTYDGRNTGAVTMTLSSAGGWDYDDTITITASSSYFASTDVGFEIHLEDADGDVIRVSIETYSSATVVTGKPHKTVPASLQATATTSWSKAVDVVSGLWHLEDQAVSVFADGFVVASPNNASYETITVADGFVELDKCYSVIHVGRPYTCDIESLDIDSTNAETLIDKFKKSGDITLQVEDTRGLWAGAKPPTDDDTDPLEGLTEFKVRNDEGYESPVNLKTGVMDVIINAQWNNNGRVFLRQVDPLPASVLAIAPAGSFPFKR